MRQCSLYLTKAIIRVLLCLIGTCILSEHAISQQMKSKVVTEGIHLSVSTGWNLLSLPANVTNGTKSLLFPNATSQAYIYDPQNGYQLQDTLTSGVGFWLKFGTPQTVSLSGDGVVDDTIPVLTGWNLIGSIAVPITTDSVETAPPGIINSKFYCFVPGNGYQQTDTLKPGFGYWVKVSQNGVILPSWKSWKGVIFADSTIEPESLPNFVSVIVDTNQLIFTYESTADLPKLFPGQKLLGYSEGGYARKVLSFSTNGNQLTVLTDYATFSDIVVFAQIDTTYELTFPDSLELDKLFGQPLNYEETIDGKRYKVTSSKPEIRLSPDAQILSRTFPNFGFEIIGASGVQLAISTSALTISIPVPIAIPGISWTNRRLDRMSLRVLLQPTFEISNLQLSLSGEFDAEREIELMPPIPLGRFAHWAVGGVITSRLKLYGGAEGQMNSDFQWNSGGTITANSELDAGVTYSNGNWVTHWNPTTSAVFSTNFQATGGFQSTTKLFIKPTVEFVWNGIAQANISVKGFGYLDASAFPFTAEAGVGAEGTVEANLDLFFPGLYAENFTLVEVKRPLWTTKGPDQPNNPQPENDATNVDKSSTLHWTGSHPTGNPLKYNIYLATENPPQTMIASNLNVTSLSLSNLLPETKYYWIVEAQDNNGNKTKSPVWNFTVGFYAATPTLLSPPNGSTEQVVPLTFTWSASLGATGYTLQISESSLFGSFVYNQSGLTDTTLQISDLDDVTTYFWRVSATANDLTSAPSEPWSFTTGLFNAPDPPLLIIPFNGATAIPVLPTLTWTPSPTATSYQVQVSTNSSFSSFVYNESGLTATNTDVPNLEYSTIYFWRVNAMNSVGVSDWSDVWSFQTEVLTVPPIPSIIFPNDNNSLAPWVMCAPPNVRTDNYTIQVSTDDSFTSINFEYTLQQSSNPYRKLDEVEGSTTYYLRMRANNMAGSSDWTTIISFTTITVSSSCGSVFHAGKLLTTTRIGDQCWLTDNLNVGTTIHDTLLMTNNGITEKYCYNNNPSNCSNYGALYTWQEAMNYSTGEGAQGICPSGWHIPTYSEFTTLTLNYVNQSRRPLLKVGQVDGTNNSGFSALRGGIKYDGGGFSEKDDRGYWWSSSMYSAVGAWGMMISTDIPSDQAVQGFGHNINSSVNVRCIKN